MANASRESIKSFGFRCVSWLRLRNDCLAEVMYAAISRAIDITRNTPMMQWAARPPLERIHFEKLEINFKACQFRTVRK
jgi:hypothetical protein